MSVSTLCHGCGGRVTVPDDDNRARVRCPQCGVLCDLPTRPARKPAAKEPPTVALDDGAAVLLEEDAPSERPAPRSKTVKPAVKPKVVVPPPPPTTYDHSQDPEDSKPYFVPGLDEHRPCPGCRSQIPRDAVFCTKCGLDLRVGKKVVQEYEPVERHWHSGMSLPLRIVCFLAADGLLLSVMGLTAYSQELPVFGWLFPSLFFTVMMAFLFGTFDRIHLKRNKKGRVKLTKSWSVCFLPRPPHEVDVHDYQGVCYGYAESVSGADVMIMLFLLIAGIFPGILFGIFFVFRSASQVALTRDHGHAAFILYRGADRDLMLEIAMTVIDVAHLRDET